MDSRIGAGAEDGRRSRRSRRRSLAVRLAAAAVVSMAAGAAAFGAASMQPPLYRAETRILVDVRPRDLASEAPADRALVERAVVDSQVQLLTSPDLARRVAERLRLADHPSFGGDRGGAFEAALATLGLGRDPARISPEERVLDRFARALAVRPVDGTRVVSIAVETPDGDLAARLADAVAAEYVAMHGLARRRVAETEAAALEVEVERRRDDLRRADAALAAARAAASGPSDGAIVRLGTADLAAEAAAADAERAEAEATAAEFVALLDGEDVAGALTLVDTPAMDALRRERADLDSRLGALAGLPPGHPRIADLRARLADVEARQRREAERFRAVLEGRARIAAARSVALAEGLLAARGAAPGVTEKPSVSSLEADSARLRELLAGALVRHREVLARLSPEEPVAEARVIARATASDRPVTPAPALVAGAASLGTLVLFSLLIALADRRSRRRVAPATAAPPPKPLALSTDRQPASVRPPPSGDADPRVSRFRAMVEAAARRRQEAEAAAPPIDPVHRPGLVQSDAASLHATLIADGSNRVALMTVEDGEALEPVVADLSRTATEDGTRVVVVDTVATHAGRGGPGLSDLVAGEAAFGEIIRRNRATRAHEIGVGSRPLDPDLLDAEMLETMLSALESAYDLVLLSLGDMEADSIRFRLVAAADHVVLVGDPDDPRIARACRVLAASGVDAISIMPSAARSGWGAAA